MANTAAWLLPILAALGLVLLWKSVMLVRHASVVIIERFGKYHTTLKPGLRFIIPFIDTPREVHWRFLEIPRGRREPVVRSLRTDRIDLREHVIDLGRQSTISRDTVLFQVDALVYFQISDPRLAVFKVQNVPDAVELLTQATLRNIIAHLTLDESLSSRDEVNRRLLSVISRDAERWGVTVTRVEIFNIIPPNDIRQVMEQQIRAERTRRSTVLQADGEKEAQIIESRGTAAELILAAEGQRTSDLLVAKGEADAKLLVARAQTQAIEIVREALAETNANAVEYLTAMEYLEALGGLAGSPDDRDRAAKVVLLPAKTVRGIGQLTSLNGPRAG